MSRAYAVKFDSDFPKEVHAQNGIWNVISMQIPPGFALDHYSCYTSEIYFYPLGDDQSSLYKRASVI